MCWTCGLTEKCVRLICREHWDNRGAGEVAGIRKGCDLSFSGALCLCLYLFSNMQHTHTQSLSLSLVLSFSPFFSFLPSSLTPFHTLQVNLAYELFHESVRWDKSCAHIKCKICRKSSDDSEMLLCDGSVLLCFQHHLWIFFTKVHGCWAFSFFFLILFFFSPSRPLCSCDHGFHMFCLKPRLYTIPEGQWFCNACKVRWGIVQWLFLSFFFSFFFFLVIFPSLIHSLTYTHSCTHTLSLSFFFLSFFLSFFIYLFIYFFPSFFLSFFLRFSHQLRAESPREKRGRLSSTTPNRYKDNHRQSIFFPLTFYSPLFFFAFL